MSSTWQSLHENMNKYELLLCVSIWERVYRWTLAFVTIILTPQYVQVGQKYTAANIFICISL